MRVIRYFRSLLEALQGLAVSMAEVAAAVLFFTSQRPPEGDIDGRVTALELSRTKWEADLEGLVAKAEGQYRAAANAEARARTHAKAAEVFDDDDQEGEQDLFSQYLEELSKREVSPGEIDAVQAVRDNMGYAAGTRRESRKAKKAAKRERRA